MEEENFLNIFQTIMFKLGSNEVPVTQRNFLETKCYVCDGEL